MKWRLLNGNYTIEPDGLSTIRAEKYILSINTGKYQSKVLQIIFHKDGSIFITFPYFPHTDGIVSLITFPPNIKGATNLSALDGGKATSHLVKYSYHPDGNVLFSQDGKVYTKIRKLCPPINQLQGPFFSARIQGLGYYEQINLEKEKTNKPQERAFVEAILEKRNPAAVKISGLVYQREILRRDIKGNISEPVVTTRDSFNKTSQTCLCSAPSGHKSENTIVLLNCEIVPRIDKDSEAHLSFIGGFDEKSVALDQSKETTFLFFAYPANNIDELTQKIGSIDFKKP